MVRTRGAAATAWRIRAQAGQPVVPEPDEKRHKFGPVAGRVTCRRDHRPSHPNFFVTCPLPKPIVKTTALIRRSSKIWANVRGL
jgi:hypothetical protein